MQVLPSTNRTLCSGKRIKIKLAHPKVIESTSLDHKIMLSITGHEKGSGKG